MVGSLHCQPIIYDGDAPVASADFFYAPRTLVLVDGSPHYRDYIAAADQAKRKRSRQWDTGSSRSPMRRLTKR
jgi:hypothetical protein